MGIAPLRFVEITVLAQDLRGLLTWLGTEGEVQLEPQAGDGGEAPRELLEKVRQALAQCQEAAPKPKAKGRPRFPLPVMDIPRVGALADQVLEEAALRRNLVQSRTQTLDLLGRLDQLPGSGSPDLAGLRYTRALVIPGVSENNLGLLAGCPGLYLVTAPAPRAPSENGYPLLALVRSDQIAQTETWLQTAGFSHTAYPADLGASPGLLRVQAQNHLAQVEAELGALELRFHELAVTSLEELRTAELTLQTERFLAQEVQNRRRGKNLAVLQGWVAEDRWDETREHLAALCENRLRIRTLVPSSRSHPREPSPPTLLRSGPWTGGFGRLVLAYGTPAYSGVDPTPWLAVTFPLLFGLMFGDLGQGLLIACLGFFLAKGAPSRLSKWKPTAPAFILCGLWSALGGLVYGSCFSNEQILVPFGRLVTSLWGPAQDRILNLLPDPGVEKLFLFFGFTLVLGLVLLLAGQALHIRDCLRAGQTVKALLSVRGLAGSLFLVTGAALGCVHLGGSAFQVVELVPLAVLLVLMVANSGAHGPLALAVEGFEIVSGLFTKALSFLRVGAFALAHAVLGLCILTLAHLASGGGSAGPGPGSLAVFLAGNLVILTLEALVVTIQVVRLHYYEFFSQFFTQTGVLFRPFRLYSQEVFP